MNDKERPEHVVLPLRAPELIVDYPDWDQKVDIWSYGLVVSESPKDGSATRADAICLTTGFQPPNIQRTDSP